MARDAASFSSDEEDDHRNLIHQNDTKPVSPAEHRAASFDVEDFETRIGGDRRSKLAKVAFNKRYLVAVVLPIFIVVLYFTADLRSLFSYNLSSIKADSFGDRMRESELRALYLLKQQQLGLLTLWNQTFRDSGADQNSSLSGSNSSEINKGHQSLASSSASFDDFKSAVLKQISWNKEIQDVLLLPHQSGNLSVEGAGDVGLANFGEYGFDRCKKVDQRFSERRTSEWNPKSNKFLLAICLSGQMSNHLICLEKHMFFAAVLNRVLVIPSSRVDFRYHRVLDVDHINQCLGRKVVISFEEFSEIRKKHLHIDRFICYFSLPQHCYVDDEHVKKLKNLGLSMGKLESPWVEDVKRPNKRTVQDIQAKFASNDDVIAIGDVFFADVEREWVMQPGGPLAHKCKTLIEPSRLIMLTAERFIQTFLGKDYIALHFRRHGFLKFCNAKKPSCFYPIPQAADCISRVVGRANTPVIYLSTDAAESETGMLQSLIVVNGRVVPLVKRPASNSAEKWDALLYRHGLQDDAQVEAMLDKTICAMSSVFIGASGSTFTEDILRLRKDWGSASVCDEYLCQGEEPNFIAGNE
ncbi:O-fucosyltransferase 36-like [Rhodamnia argentea]|uniref:GDP-fucose protein O-fucosyltransferase 2 n=1 Tax=Rhodamnia argentea TaxID=178133 RepID=A0A8B8PNK6_9MYRT|nr:O-fucosyltransferase 36-like [Rhodamnia argentea]